MTKYCDPQQHQLNKLSHLWEGAWDLYSKPQAESRVSVLEKEVTELRHKLSKASKAHEVLGNQIKKIPQLETKVANLKHANAVQRSVHQAEVESHRAEVEAHRAEIERLLQEHAAQLRPRTSSMLQRKYTHSRSCKPTTKPSCLPFTSNNTI